jgi:tetratricopeptide (TPR) repeat protein
MDECIERARALCDRAVFYGDVDALAAADAELDTVQARAGELDARTRADLALVRGRIVHARFLRDRVEDPREAELFEDADRLYRELGDARGEAAAQLWLGIFHQVVRDDEEAAVPELERCAALATEVGDDLTLSYALRHLAFADHGAQRLDSARRRLEESTRLRRALDFLPGVAANLVGLAHVANAQGRRDDAIALLDEADEIVTATGARPVVTQIAQARAAVQGGG